MKPSRETLAPVVILVMRLERTAVDGIIGGG
jgi:hypothetical protein